MQDVFSIISKIAPSSVTALLLGESGTGKELVARAIHEAGNRRDKAFVKVNCAALPETLLESELFGHERGAFTGAQALRKGRFEQADGGTLFLDEIGDMPADLQTRLLRVLSDGQFYRVGGHNPIKVNVRVIAATHQDMEERVKAGLFREDLFHRLNVIRLRLPALREREEDIPDLARHFLQQSAQQLGVETKILSDDTLNYLSHLHWRGNVRQLENVCHWLTVMAPGQNIDIADLPPELKKNDVYKEASADWKDALKQEVQLALNKNQKDILTFLNQTFEKILIEEALRFTKGRRIEAAEMLGLGRNTLTRKVKELKIEK